MNKILFLGDSFTWGQGLYFYKWKEENRILSSDIGGMFPAHSKYIKEDDLIYKDKLSFTGIVSDYYGLEQVKRTLNGGSNTDIILDMMSMIDRYNNSIEKLVFQFTSVSRYKFRDLNINDNNSSEIDLQTYSGSWDSFFQQRSFDFFNYVDGILKYFSKLYNFDYCYMDWLGDFYKFNPHKFVKYNQGSNYHYYFDKLLEEYKIDIDIKGHKIIDLHLNKDAQEILSNAIISYFG